ncbi:MAG: hypothetical protein WCP26_05400 [Actinomycetes bacterium]
MHLHDEVTNVESLAVLDPAASLKWEVEGAAVALADSPVDYQRGVFTRRHHLLKVADVVDVFVRDEHPPWPSAQSG